MAKIAITADWHVHSSDGSSKHLQNCIDSAKWVLHKAQEIGCQHLVHCGDVFDDREMVHIKALHEVSSMIREASASMEITVLLGNHDMYSSESWECNSISCLSSEKVRVVDKPTSFEICGMRADFMPYTQSPATALAEYFPENRRGELFFGHFGVHDAVTNGTYGTRFASKTETKEMHQTMFFGWKMGFLGHFHRMQKIKYAEHVCFVGSQMQLSMSEAGDEKGFLVLETTDMSISFYRNEFSPKRHIMWSLADAAAAKVASHDLIFVKPKDMMGMSVQAMKAAVADATGCENVKVYPPDAPKQVAPVKEGGGLDSLVAASDHEEIVRRYCEYSAMPPDVAAIGLDIVKNARSR